MTPKVDQSPYNHRLENMTIIMAQGGLNKPNYASGLQSVDKIPADCLVTAINDTFDSGVRCSRYLKNTGCLDRPLVIGVGSSFNCFCSGPTIDFPASR
jgi:hypothetical protein